MGHGEQRSKEEQEEGERTEAAASHERGAPRDRFCGGGSWGTAPPRALVGGAFALGALASPFSTAALFASAETPRASCPTSREGALSARSPATPSARSLKAFALATADDAPPALALLASSGLVRPEPRERSSDCAAADSSSLLALRVRC